METAIIPCVFWNDAFELNLRSAHPKRHIFEFRTNDLGTIGLWGDA